MADFTDKVDTSSPASQVVSTQMVGASSPSELDVRVVQDAQDMTMLSTQIDPLVFSDTFARFKFDNKGILDSNTTLQCCILAANGGGQGSPEAQSFLPIGVGAHSLIQRARLLIGGKIVSSIDNNPYYQAVVKGFQPTDDRALRSRILQGDLWDWNIHKNLDREEKDNTIGMNKFFIPSTSQPQATLETTPQYAIPLSELFPVLKHKMLPLFAMDEDVIVEIEMNNADGTGANAGGRRLCYNGDVASGTAADNNIVGARVGWKLYADYLFYENDQMMALGDRLKSGGFSFVYPDIQSTTKVLQSASTNENFEIGGQGRVIRSLMAMKTRAAGVGLPSTGFSNFSGAGNGGAAANPEASSLLGRYVSQAEDTAAGGSFKFNLRVNDRRLFNSSLNTAAKLHYFLSETGNNGGYWCNTGLYSYDTNAANISADGVVGAGLNTATNTMTTPLNEMIGGQFQPIGVHFGNGHENYPGNGVQVEQKPILVEYERVGAGATPVGGNGSEQTWRFFLVYERTFSLRDGKVFISA
tara:strand:+ start:5318 stop:6898 length:1581 start_codon:yes stop_codon:yes gene_type:complete